MIRFLFVLLAVPLWAVDAGKLERELDEIGRVATIMVDGDVCQRILTKRALEHMLKKDPRDQYADGDNYDVDDEAFIRTKKTLIRLAMLSDSQVDVNLWMPLPADPPRIHIVIRNRYEMSQFWEWGKLHQEMFPVMRTTLGTGRRITVKDKPGFISVLAPVRNSLGEITGLVEVVSRLQPDARENVK
jgi:hypothetical protein